MTRIPSTLRLMAVAGLFAVAGAGQALAAEQTGTSDAQWMERMQQHWQQVIQETDPQKRQALMREHEEIMSQAVGPQGDQGAMGADHMGMGSGRLDMMNTVDMHRHMMDMMR